MKKDEFGKPKKQEYLYLIDGVGVPRKIYFRRQVFGEYPGAKFEIVKA